MSHQLQQPDHVAGCIAVSTDSTDYEINGPAKTVSARAGLR